MPVFYAYVAIVALQAVAAHANTRIGFGLLKYLVVTPQYHHWHHADDPKYYNKNFAIHLPIIDRVLVPTTFQAMNGQNPWGLEMSNSLGVLSGNFFSLSSATLKKLN
ncbi:sterol desaturase family protein [Verrucomicrobia bacterium]|jgi:sterol desaturase/sphingolipid hydroxylase (fatty acid hydroxylase superfamily)|nr:sterol desaturase family protein [Verrucomicrobiota bacterium]MDB4690853.1 sterol desaturase family protein [Verrucomicrobiota bacterium]MDB4717747.1 sterol desaturase family protein [Verrucomicrobiota bacterium]